MPALRFMLAPVFRELGVSRDFHQSPGGAMRDKLLALASLALVAGLAIPTGSPCAYG